MTDSRVVVTGGCGFVGARLCARLTAAGYEVVALDNLSLGSPCNLSAAGVDGVSVVAADMRDTVAVTRYLDYYRPRTVFHMAAMHFIPACDADPAACIDVNVGGTQALLDACQAVSTIDTVVLASTAAVYAPSAHAHGEDSTLGPTDIYGLSKLWTEQLGELFHRKTGINVGIARLFNVFGPGETNPHLIPTIIEQARAGHNLRLGNLSTQRDYVFVDDVASALIALADACRHHRLLTCNVGSERQIDGERLVHVVEDVAGHSLAVYADPARVRASDRPYLLSDCRRAHDLLGWRAETDLEEGLREAVKQPLAPGSSRL